ncbi:MAG TPA: acyl-CoA dehydrogenase family protein [Thermomicrobiaceae bacterium]|nr:acyl-CoA dehydrogenase family protein [Thermomicrobiaceae bacterium]
MDLFYTAEDEAFRARVRAWLAENLPRKRLETLEEQRAWQRKLHEAGYLGMGWPVEYGGQNARPMEQAIVGEELARVNAPGAVGGLGVSIVGPTLIHHGTEAQKQRFVKNILSAEEIWCQLYSEPNSGSDLASLRTRAEIVGDEFVINGQKVWNSGAHRSDWGLLLARTDPEAPKHLGISCILVDMRSPGVEVRPLRQISGSSEFCEVFFSDVHVPREHLIGELNRGWQIAQTTLSYERGGNTMSRVSRQLAVFQRLMEVASVLRRDGTRAIDNPVIRQKLGRMYAEIEVLRYGSLRILSAAEKGQRPGPESSVTKLYYSEMDKRQQELIQEIMGPYGQLIEGEPAAYAQDADASYGESGSWAYSFAWSRAGTIYAGSSEIQKNIIGERVLGLPKEIRADRIEAQQAAAQAGRAGNGAS